MSKPPTQPWVHTTPALVQLLARSGGRHVAAGFAAAGMSGLQPRHALLLVPLLGSGRHASDLAELLGVSRQAVASVVMTLERGGYVERVADPDDARAKLIRLTPQGLGALRVMRTTAQAVERRWEQELGGEGVAQFRATLLTLLSIESDPPLT